MKRFCSSVLALVLMIVFVATASAVTVTPSSLLGWGPQNIRFTGTVAIDATYPRTGVGSLHFTQQASADKADFEIYNLSGFGRLADLSDLRFDVYRNSSSSVMSHFAPALRLVVVDPHTNQTSLLIWEYVYNVGAVVPTDSWNTFSIRDGNFWMRAFGSPSCTVENYTVTLNQWLSGGPIFSCCGCTPNTVGPDAIIIGLSIGVGSGWNGTFDGAVDNASWTLNGVTTTWNFETEQATPTTKSTWGNVKSYYR